MKQLLNILLFSFSILSFSQQSNQEKSENGATIKWQKYEINNNKWGEHKIKKGVYSQTIFTTDTAAGWKWQTPGKKYGVVGYPEIWFGESAWFNLTDIKTDNYFKNINEVKTFEVDYKTKLEVNDKKYNLAFDFWLHNSPKVALQTIGIEVMIWEDYNKFKPFGKKVGNIFTTFGQYDIYRGNIIKKDLNFLKKSTGIESLFFINNGKIIFCLLTSAIPVIRYPIILVISSSTQILTSSDSL